MNVAVGADNGAQFHAPFATRLLRQHRINRLDALKQHARIEMRNLDDSWLSGRFNWRLWRMRPAGFAADIYTSGAAWTIVSKILVRIEFHKRADWTVSFNRMLIHAVCWRVKRKPQILNRPQTNSVNQHPVEAD